MSVEEFSIPRIKSTMPTSFQPIGRQPPVNLWDPFAWAKGAAQTVSHATQKYVVRPVVSTTNKVAHTVDSAAKKYISEPFDRTTNTAARKLTNSLASAGVVDDLYNPNHSMGQTVTCGTLYGIGKAAGIDQYQPFGINIDTRDMQTNKSHCGCVLKADSIVQRFANSKERVRDVVYGKLRPKCNTQIMGLTLLNQVNMHQKPIEKVMGTPANSEDWKSYISGYTIIKQIKDELVDGLNKANVALGKCHSHNNTNTLNKTCYELQQTFGGGVCQTESKCCVNLLKQACR